MFKDLSLRSKIFLVGIVLLIFPIVIILFPKIIQLEESRYPVKRQNNTLSPDLSQKKSDITWWDVESIDTMKSSRDLAKEKLNEASYDHEIDAQVANIKQTGANFIGIDTPLDEEFYPFLKRWVNASRNNNLHIWFRGNFSSWEGWFNKPKNMTFKEHIQKSHQFITSHPELFLDGDSFTSCPECENGAGGDPRSGNLDAYRNFLVSEIQSNNEAFDSINKKVNTNWLSMNKDVASLVMDKNTLLATGGILVIDHYVKDPLTLNEDIKELGEKTGAKIILGEFGAPIDGLTDNLTEQEQAQWLKQALDSLATNKYLIGLNYWVNKGGSTALWEDDNQPRVGQGIVKKYYQPREFSGVVKDQSGSLLDDVYVSTNKRTTRTKNGQFRILSIDDRLITFYSQGYLKKEVSFTTWPDSSSKIDVVMLRESANWFLSMVEALSSINFHVYLSLKDLFQALKAFY